MRSMLIALLMLATSRAFPVDLDIMLEIHRGHYHSADVMIQAALDAKDGNKEMVDACFMGGYMSWKLKSMKDLNAFFKYIDYVLKEENLNRNLIIKKHEELERYFLQMEDEL